MKKRSQIKDIYKWDLTEYLASDDDIDKVFDKVKTLKQKLTEYQGKLSDDSVLYECLENDREVGEIEGRLYVYLALKLKEDAKNNFYKNKLNILEKFESEMAPKLSYITSEINEFSDDKLLKLASDERFKLYDLMFKDVIKQKPHILSPVEERLMASISECIGGHEELFDNLDAVDIKFDDVEDSKGKKYPLNNSNYAVYIQSSDQTLRKCAFKNLNGAYGKLNYTIASNYMGSVKTDCTIAKVRKFDSAFKQSLFSEEVDESVYLTLINSVNKNLKLFHKYFDHKKKALNLTKFYNFDANAKLKLKSSKKYTYDEAYNTVCNALSVLGEDYINMLNIAKTKQWIDVMPNLNKDTGAFSWGAYGAHPVVMLNFEGTTNCVFTLAHELGHMMHTYYSNKNNPSTKAGYEIFVAEVASTTNEILLAKSFLNKAKTKEEKSYYIDYILNMFYGTVCRQTMFSEFEYLVHDRYEKGEDTTVDSINKLYLDLAKKYFGKNVILENELKYEWSRIPHFYNSFYVYKYATGLISALAISNNILSGKTNAVENYKKFLSSGGTMSPVELLKIAGVDLTDEKTFKKAFKFINELLNSWENLD